MRILLSGSTGLIGSATARLLRQQGHEILRLIRPGATPRRDAAASAADSTAVWDPVGGALDSAADGSDAVVHLAGASIAGGRWTAARKRLIAESRVTATRNLVGALARLSRPPRIFVAASAIGYYGNCGDRLLTEESPAGGDFLAGVCRDWEAESARAAGFGARVVLPRFGIVLARHGGALGQMMLPFRLGFGGPIGSGRQWMSWISLEDVAGIIAYAISSEPLSGPVNAVAPNPVRNAEFVKDLGRALHRLALLPAPAFALRLALGEMADALLLASQRVVPQKLERLHYPFLHRELPSALAAVLAEPR